MTSPSSLSRNATEPALAPVLADFELSSLLGYRLLRLSTLIGNLAQRDSQRVASLTLPEYRVLVVLLSKGPSGVVALQQHMLIDKAWISRTLTSLGEKKLVVSETDPEDARRTVYTVTLTGKEAGTALIEKAVERQQRILKGLSAEELSELSGYLERIRANVEAEGL